MSTRHEKLNNSTDNRGPYKVLIDSVKLVSELPGLTCEIGVRAGGSSYKIMREKQRCDDKVYILVLILLVIYYGQLKEMKRFV